MFEFSVACKYLLPRRRQLSVSIISILSILVIAVVVWLLIVFFSVTMGLEKTWVNKLVSITAPVRLTPTEAYYNSYYYNIDSISSASNYSFKSIGEKLNSTKTDPYDPAVDEELPSHWPSPSLLPNGEPKDIIKLTFQSVNELKPNFPGLYAKDFETAFGTIRLRLIRKNHSPSIPSNQDTQTYISQSIYLSSFNNQNPSLHKTLLPLSSNDYSNLLNLITLSSGNLQEDAPDNLSSLDISLIKSRLTDFFNHLNVSELNTPNNGWKIPFHLLKDVKFPIVWSGCLMFQEGRENGIPYRIMIPQHANDLHKLYNELDQAGFKCKTAQITLNQTKLAYRLLGTDNNEEKEISMAGQIPLYLAGNTQLPVKLISNSINNSRSAQDLLFDSQFEIQGTLLKGDVSYRNLIIGKAEAKIDGNKKDYHKNNYPLWAHLKDSSESHHNGSVQLVLPQDENIGDGVLLPKSFRDAGILIGDRGYIAYFTPTASSMMEQRLPVYAAGFYDPGMIPLGGKLILVNQELTSIIRGSYAQEEQSLGNGINVYLDDLSQAEPLKTALQKTLEDKHIAHFWNIETYKEYEFAKEVLQQLQSEKHIFTLISIVIIIVACSNIISMLIILVNDKKKEIGVLSAMGATSRSIAMIFGLCGVIIGMCGGIIGAVAAILTLRHLNDLINLISTIQGYKAFNAPFFGEFLPNELNVTVLGLVLGATALISLIAGLIPAIKASLLKPAAVLRSE